MLTEISGLPAHVLLIHAIVVLAPLGALFTILSAVWPKARRRIGVFGPVTCLIVLVLTPVTEHAGEWLEDKLTAQRADEAIEKHADLGDTFLWFAIALFVFSAAVWFLGRRQDAAVGDGTTGGGSGGDAPTTAGGGSGGAATATATRPTTEVPVGVQYAVAAVAVLVSIATVIQLVRIGDSGANASWDYVKQLK